MLSALRTRRWVSFTLLVIVMLGICIVASRWQWNRHVTREAANAVINTNMSAPPAPVADVLPLGGSVGNAELWRRVTATGTYDSSAEVVIRKRPYGGQNGFWVITPLVTPTGTLLVNRGWVPAPGDARADPERPPAPTGEVTVTGRLRADAGDSGARGDLPANQYLSVDVRGIAAGLPGAVYPGYIELTESQPTGQSLTLIPPPEPSGGPHVFYAIQWGIFAVIGVVGWFRLIRRQDEPDPAHVTAETRQGTG